VIKILVFLRNQILKKRCAVWIVHHSRKARDSTSRFTGILCSSRFTWDIERIKNQTGTIYKTRYLVRLEREIFTIKVIHKKKILIPSLNVPTP